MIGATIIRFPTPHRHRLLTRGKVSIQDRLRQRIIAAPARRPMHQAKKKKKKNDVLVGEVPRRPKRGRRPINIVIDGRSSACDRRARNPPGRGIMITAGEQDDGRPGNFVEWRTGKRLPCILRQPRR